MRKTTKTDKSIDQATRSLPPLTRSVLGAIKLPKGFNIKKSRADYLEDKYS